jgi:putative PIN family toxin of toxin-antitoxin system
MPAGKRRRKRLPPVPAAIRVVVDTNILVSAGLSILRDRASHERRLIEWILSQQIDSPELLLSDDVLEEYATVLYYPKFGFAPDYIEETLDELEDLGVWAIPVSSSHRARHAADQKFLDCVEGGDADYLITGNKKDFPDLPWIVNARKFFEDLDDDDQ